MRSTPSSKKLIEVIGERMLAGFMEQHQADPDGVYLDRIVSLGQPSMPSAPMRGIYVRACQDAIGHAMRGTDHLFGSVETYHGNTGEQFSDRLSLARTVESKLRPYVDQFGAATGCRLGFNFYAVSEWPEIKPTKSYFQERAEQMRDELRGVFNPYLEVDKAKNAQVTAVARVAWHTAAEHFREVVKPSEAAIGKLPGYISWVRFLKAYAVNEQPNEQANKFRERASAKGVPAEVLTAGDDCVAKRREWQAAHQHEHRTREDVRGSMNRSYRNAVEDLVRHSIETQAGSVPMDVLLKQFEHTVKSVRLGLEPYTTEFGQKRLEGISDRWEYDVKLYRYKDWKEFHGQLEEEFGVTGLGGGGSGIRPLQIRRADVFDQGEERGRDRSSYLPRELMPRGI